MTKQTPCWPKHQFAYVAIALAVAVQGFARADTAHQVRAAFIYNFSKYIDFPQGAVPDGRPFVVGIVGEDTYSGDLDAALTGKTVRGHGFEIKHVRSESDLRSCQFLIVGESNSSEARKTLRSVEGAPVVTIGEGGDFARLGGTIAFVTSENRVRFEVNLASSRAARISISSRMLSLALQVYR